MLKVWTAQYRYRETDRLDITVKTGVAAFAPSWTMVHGIKNRTLAESQYYDMYQNLMTLSQRYYKEKWDALLARDEVTLVCFCPAGDFCHRVLLAHILEKMGAQYMGERSL